MGTVGVQEMILIFIVALVLFGPKKLPELGRTIGKAISEFRRATSDLKTSFEREMHNLERETEALKEKETQQQAIETAIPQPSEYDYHSYNADTSEYVYTPDPTPSDPVPNHPSTVSATEVPGAESHGTVEPAAREHVAEAAPGVEGTVPRVEATTQHS